MNDFMRKLVLDSKAGTLENFKPLPKTKNEPLYAQTGLTQDEFRDLYPKIPVKNVFFDDTITGQSLVYWDSENFVLSYMHIFHGGQRFAFNNESNDVFSDRLLRVAKEAIEQRKNKEYGRLLYPFSDAIRIDIMNRLLEEDGPSKELCNAFISWYKCSDYGFGNLDINKVIDLMKYLPEEEQKTSDSVLKALPDTITIYRGEGSKSTPYTKAMSWTLDPNVALWYGSRFEREDVRLISGTCKKEDVLFAYDSEDSDKELLVCASEIQNIKVEHQYGMEIIEDFSLMEYYHQYRDKLVSDLRVYYENSNSHSALHVARVLLLSLLIADNNERMLTDGELKKLCLAAIYHDIGRRNDTRDKNHGMRGAEIYKKLEKVPAASVEWLIAYHDKSDEAAKKALTNIATSQKSRESYWMLYEILKDADALDRVRFPVSSKDSLDIRMLRRPQSKDMYAVAMSVFEEITL